MFQRKRRSGVYLHIYTRFKTVTTIIFILIISSVIAADSKCKLTSKITRNCDQPRLTDDDSDNGMKDNTKSIPHGSHSSHNHHHHNKLQLNEMKNSIYKYVNDMINTRTSQILANSMNQLLQQAQQGQHDQYEQLEQQQLEQLQHHQQQLILQQKERGMEVEVENEKVSESQVKQYMMGIEELLDYLDTPAGNVTNGRQLGASEGRLFFFKGNC